MQKLKIILLGATISSLPVSALALDLQSKFRNTDRSLLETVSDYQTIEPGRFYFSNTASLISNPLVDKKSGKVLIDSMKDTEFSVVGSFYKNWELGLSVPYFQTTAAPGSSLNGYTGMGDIYLESKFNFFDQVSIIPVYIFQPNQGLIGTGSAQGGYGLKVVGSFFEKSLFPFYYSLGYYTLPNTQYGNIDQSQRIQASLGTLYKLTKEIVAGTELYIDQAKNKTSKELLAHLTIHFDSFSLRAGAGSGFLNSDNSNDLRVFASIMFDMDFRSKEGVKITKVEPKAVPAQKKSLDKSEELEVITVSITGDTVDVFSEPASKEEKEMLDERRKQQEPKDEVEKKLQEIEDLQKSLNEQTSFEFNSKAVVASNNKIDPRILTDNSLVNSNNTSEDDYTVIPAYTVKSLKELKKNQAPAKEVSIEETLQDKNKRLKDSQNNLAFWILEYDSKRLKLEKAQKELTWGLRVVERRRNTLKDLYQDHKQEMDMLPEGKYYLNISAAEKRAAEIIKIKGSYKAKETDFISLKAPGLEKKLEVITVEEVKKEEVKKEEVKKEEVKKEEVKKELPVVEGVPTPAKLSTHLKEERISPEDREKERIVKLEAEQKRLWEVSKKQTLSDTLGKRRKSSAQFKIKTPNTNQELIQAVKEAPVLEKKVEEAKKGEISKSSEIKEDPSSKVNSGSVVLIEENTENLKKTTEVTPVDVAESNKEASKPIVETKVIVVPKIESLVSDTVEITESAVPASDTLEKVNMLLEKKKQEDLEKEKYKSLIKHYEEELAKMKKKVEEESSKKEEPLKKLEVKIENKTETKFNQDGSIEIKQFKLNSIQERFQAEQGQVEETGLQGEPEPRQNSGGLVEDGELEISSGPIY